MYLLAIYATLAIAFSFLCSILEAVLLSVTDTYLNVKKSEGASWAPKFERLKMDVDQPLIAILTLNTVAHTVGAILVGEQAGKIWAASAHPTLFGLEIPVTYVMIISVLMTLGVLIISEIIPKTIGATYWKGLASFTTNALNVMVSILKYTGILWILQLFTRLIGAKGHHGSVLSRQDLSVMSDMGAKQGILDDQESTFIKNILDIDDQEVREVMTPRTIVVAADMDQSIGEFYKTNPDLRHSRIPIYKERIDDTKGFVLKSDILKAMIENREEDSLSTIKRNLIFVPENTMTPDLFSKLTSQREHIAGVTDQFGGFAGIVTMEDIFEEMIGQEIMDETDKVADLRGEAQKKWEAESKDNG